VMNVVWDRLVPALGTDALPADTASSDRLKARLASLTLRPETTTASSSMAKSIAGRRFTFATNRRSIEAVTFDVIDASGAASLTMRMNGKDQHLKATPNAWQAETIGNQSSSDPVAVSGGWAAGDTYTLKIVRYRTPFAMTYRLRFAGDQVTLDSEENVGGADTRLMTVVGTVEHTTTR